MMSLLAGVVIGVVVHRVGYWQGQRSRPTRPAMRADNPGRWF